MHSPLPLHTANCDPSSFICVHGYPRTGKRVRRRGKEKGKQRQKKRKKTYRATNLRKEEEEEEREARRGDGATNLGRSLARPQGTRDAALISLAPRHARRPSRRRRRRRRHSRVQASNLAVTWGFLPPIPFSGVLWLRLPTLVRSRGFLPPPLMPFSGSPPV